MEIVLFTGKTEHIVATFNPKNKWVKVYQRPFKILNAMPLLGKLYDAFYTNTPFGKVITEEEAPRARQFRPRRYARHNASPFWAETDDEYPSEAVEGPYHG